MKKLLIICVLFAATAATAATWETSKGSVNFNHQTHLEVGCLNCHLAHDVEAKKASHNYCKGCHKSNNKEYGTNAPTKCKGCHK